MFVFPNKRGEDHPASRVSNRERREARREYRQGETNVADLARRHGVDWSTMNRIVHQPADWLGEE